VADPFSDGRAHPQWAQYTRDSLAQGR